MHIYNELSNALGLSVNALETKLGLSNGTIRQAISRGSVLNVKTIERIVELFPNISREYLISGKGNILIDDTNIQHVNESEINYSSKPRKSPGTIQTTSRVPFYDVDFIAGYSGEFLNAGGDKPLFWLDLPEFSNCIAFRAYSDSMEPIIKSGNILLGRKIEDWESHLEYGQIYGITTTDNRRYLKYIRKALDYAHFFLLRSEKEGYDDFEIPKDKIKNIWLIEGWLNRRT